MPTKATNKTASSVRTTKKPTSNNSRSFKPGNKLFSKKFVVPAVIVAVFGAVGLATSLFSSAATGTYGLWDDSTVPKTLAVNDSRSAEVGVKFRSKAAGAIHGIRFYKSALNTGTHTGSLWDQSGNKLASVTFSNETSNGWQSAMFATPIPVSANTTYVASYHAPTGRWSATANYFKSSSRVTQDLTALKSGVDGPNGVIRYNGDVVFPSNGDRATNYWVDVVYAPPAPVTPPPAPGPTPTPPPTVPPTPPTGSRDPLKQPFASNSIWNMPIGSAAQYVPAGLSGTPSGDVWAPMPQIDNEQIILKPGAPLTAIKYNSAAWSGRDRCSTASSTTLATVPIPADFIVGNTRDNNGAAILLQDGRTILQSQPFTRCIAGGPATSLLTFPNVDLYGDGISGAHGGSRMSSIGGSIRVGELRPGQQGMRHALKVNVNAPVDFYRCQTESECFRWPSLTSDSGSVGDYGSQSNNQNTAMKMGSLLAIPAATALSNLGLESEPGRQLAWTLQNYGAYIVDSTGGPAFALSAEVGPDGSLHNQFKADYGFDFEERVNDNTPWSRDMQRLVQALHVVNNNSPTSVGGGGTPLQPLAPPIAP